MFSHQIRVGAQNNNSLVWAGIRRWAMARAGLNFYGGTHVDRNWRLSEVAFIETSALPNTLVIDALAGTYLNIQSKKSHVRISEKSTTSESAMVLGSLRSRGGTTFDI